jgi:ABC-type thiamin/hydroxymethylpyrimidine transport system permease subunit
MILLTVFALLSVAAKQMLRLDLNLPGHSYVLYLFFLVFAAEYIPRKGAAAFLGVTAGIAAVIAGSRKGVLDVLRFLLPALGLELTRFLPVMGHPVVNRALEGLVAALVMHATKSLLNLVTGKPLEIVLVKFYPGLVTYTLIGLFCGVGSHFMVRAVKRYKAS